MEALVSRAAMILLSLHPSPASEISAFNKIRAFSSRCAGLFPFRSKLSNCSRSSALSRTTYLFTDFSHVSTVPSVAPTRDGSESLNLASPGRLKQNRDGRSFRPDGYTEVRSLEQGHVGSLDLIPETDDREQNVNGQVLVA